MATTSKKPKTPRTPKKRAVKFADDGKKSVRSRDKHRNNIKKNRNRRSKTMQPRPRSKASADDMAVKSRNKNMDYNSSKSMRSVRQKKRPKTAKATGQTVTFFSATDQKDNNNTPIIAQSSSDITFSFGAIDIPKDKMTASNLKKYQSMLDDSSIKTRKRIGDSFKFFRQLLAEQEKLLCNNLAKVHKRKKEWINNHLEYIKTNQINSNIALNPLIELELDNQSIKHQISLFGSIDLMMPKDETESETAEYKTDSNNDEMSPSMKQKIRLSKLQHETMEKLDQIIRMEAEARMKSQEAVRLEVEAKEDMRIMAIRKKEVEEQLLIAKPELDKAMTAVSSIEKSALDEIKVLKKPPKIVEMAMTAVALMLGHVIKNWKDVQKILSYKFIPSVLNYDTEKLLNQNVKNRNKVCKLYLSKEEFTFERVNKGSKVCGSLVVWVRSQIRYSEMLDVVIPMRKEIKRLKKESKRKTKLAKQLLIAVEKLKVNIENYQKECSGIINHIIDKTDEEVKNFGDKLEPLNAKFYAILNEIDC